MEERLDARLMELPAAALHELAGRISGIDEFRGWWQGRGHAFPSVLTRLQERTIEVSTDISARNASRASFSPPRNPTWGRRRAVGTGSGVRASRARPAAPHLVPREMENLVHWTTARLGSPAFHPLLVIASFLLEFLAIRPFADSDMRMRRR